MSLELFGQALHLSSRGLDAGPGLLGFLLASAVGLEAQGGLRFAALGRHLREH